MPGLCGMLFVVWVVGGWEGGVRVRRVVGGVSEGWNLGWAGLGGGIVRGCGSCWGWGFD